MNSKSNSNAQTVSPVAETTQPSFTPATNATAAQDLTPPEQDAIKGGPGGGGGVWLNHNESTASDADESTQNTDSVDVIAAQDLTPPQMDTIKGGPDFSVLLGGGPKFNHNETAASDSDADESAPSVDPVDTASVQDLSPPEQDAIKGGPGSGSSGGVWLNHNETAAKDCDADQSTPAIC